MTEIEIRWNGRDPIRGDHPVVIVGANGSGKTKLGVELERINSGATRIPAYRQIAAPEHLNLQDEETVQQQLRQSRKQILTRPWIQGSDIQQLMLKLFAEEASVSFVFTQAARHGKGTGETPPQTTASKVSDLWSKVFAGRELIFGTTPTVISRHGGTEQTYSAAKMSDGERAAFYLACAVMDAPAGLIVVDEPDTFLHPVLMRQLWDELELARPDCRFVYITHELGFALSRKNAQFLIAKPDGSHQLMHHGDAIPTTVVEEILGALTLSVTARVLIFCESTAGGPDFRLYRAWFSDTKQGVMPSGTAEQVIQSVRVTRKKELFAGGKTYGVVDGDNWDTEFMKRLESDGISPIPVNEVESLFCVEGVFLAIAQHLGMDQEQRSEALAELVAQVRRKTVPVVVTRYALQKLRNSLRSRLSALLDGVTVHPERGDVQKSIEEAVDKARWEFDPLKLFEECVIAIESAMDGEWDETLKYLHGKDILGIAANVLGVTTTRYIDLVIGGIAGALGTGLATQVTEALEKYLPPRNLGL